MNGCPGCGDGFLGALVQKLGTEGKERVVGLASQDTVRSDGPVHLGWLS